MARSPQAQQFDRYVRTVSARSSDPGLDLVAARTVIGKNPHWTGADS
jgi:hypothetical protein